MKAVAIIQARMGSRRFPGKVLQDLAGRPILAHVVERCQAIPGIDQVALTIPQGPEDDPLADWAVDHGIACHRGQRPLPGTDANDCLTAYRAAAYALGADVILRVTADCPLVDPFLAGEVLARMIWPVVFASNCYPDRTYPDGLDVEAFTWSLLEAADTGTPEYARTREHVTTEMRLIATAPDLATASLRHSEDLSAVRWTVDMIPDMVRVREIVRHLQAGAFSLADTLKAAEEADWPV